uniref:Beta-defensin n=1 Tax=Ursus americanus TaxID=9643 RepID=A0A452SDY9_URSAM
LPFVLLLSFFPPIFNLIPEYLLSFEMIFCGGQKSCWIIKGHCRKNCKSGEQVKKPCKNGDYCCIPSKTNSQPHRPTQPLTRRCRTVSTNSERNDVSEHVAFSHHKTSKNLE